MTKQLVISIVAVLVLGGTLMVILDRTNTTYERPPEIKASAVRPPAPDFFEPVDYVTWMRDQFAEGRPLGSSEAYSRFWPQPHSSEVGMPSPSKAARSQLLSLATGPVWRAGQHDDVDDYLSSVDSILGVFKDEVERAPGFQFVPKPDMQDPSNPMLVSLPKIDGSRHAVPCLIALAWRDGADHQVELLDAWRLGLQHARHLQESKQLILVRTALSIRMTVYESMRAAASLDALDANGVKSALELLSTVDPGTPDLRESVRIEWGGTLGFVQALYPRGRLNRELADMIGYVGGKSPRFVESDEVRASGVSPASLAEAADRHYAQLLEIAASPISNQLMHRLAALDAENASGPIGGHTLRPSVQPDLRLVFREALRTSTTRRGTYLVMSLLNHFQTEGQLPSNLAEACGNHEQRLDPCSDGEFVYSTQDSSKPSGFKLYSFGEDGVDNEGNRGSWGDIDKRTNPQGVDIVLWPFEAN